MRPFMAAAVVQCVVAHNLGLHGLLPAHPPSPNPDLAEITGPFTVDVTMRFDVLPSVGSSFQRGFDFGLADTANGNNNIRFGQAFEGLNMYFAITDGSGNLTELFTTSKPNVVGQVITWTAGVEADGTMFIKKDGVLVSPLQSGPVPADVSRPLKLIGRSRYPNDASYLEGAVLGIKVVNLNNRDRLRELEFLNMPGQMRSHGFTASMYARFDDTSRKYQRVFDIGIGAGDCEVWFGQVATSNKMGFGVTNNYNLEDKAKVETSGDVIVEGEEALWHCGFESTGRMFVVKDGVEVATILHSGFSMSNCFRSEMLVGESLWATNGDKPIHGCILGLRIDLHSVS